MSARSAGGFASWGDCNSTSACPRPCGESTTRKKLASATNGPSGFSFSEMPGFSPDQSTVPGKLIGSAITAPACGGIENGTSLAEAALALNEVFQKRLVEEIGRAHV